MGPIWGRQDPGGPHVGPMNLAIWDCFKCYLITGIMCWLLQKCNSFIMIGLCSKPFQWICECDKCVTYTPQFFFPRLGWLFVINPHWNTFTFSIISQNWIGTGCWIPTLWKTKKCLACIVNIIGAVFPSIEGSRASAPMVLAYFYCNIQVNFVAFWCICPSLNSVIIGLVNGSSPNLTHEPF